MLFPQKRILVVDDDEGVCVLLSDLLSGHRIQVEQTLEGALRALQSSPFDVVVTDGSISTPGDGKEVVGEAKKRKIPVFVFSGEVGIMEWGADGTSFKPNTGPLITEMRKILNNP